MRGLGTLINTGTVLVGGSVGYFIGHRIPENIRTIVVQVIGIATLFMGIDNIMDTHNLVFPLVGVVLGAIIGELLKIEERLEGLGAWLKRKFAREGSVEELDLPDTIRSTAANAGYLDIKMIPERHNNVKVLLLMDVGGTMDDHVHKVEELFSAAKSEFKHLEFYYFHNCVYDFMWKNNKRRFAEKFATWDILRKYNKDYKLIFIGDATMSPYEILQPGGSVEYNNEEAGAEWLQRLTHAFPKYAWINPEPQGVWQYRQSIAIVQQLMSQRMFPLTLKGLEDAMRLLSK